MIRALLTRSPEFYAIGNAIIGVLLAALLTRIPAAAFGSFWQMAMVFIVADLIVYIVMKIGWIRMLRPRN